MSFQSQKQIGLNFYRDLENSNVIDTSKVILKYCSKDLLWRGYEPFNEIIGAEKLCTEFWQPFKKFFQTFKDEWIFS